MANTHDYIISNDTGSNVRGDFNTLFLEIEASNAGDSAPSNVAAGKLWMDTTTDTLKYYTGSDWVSIGRQVKGSANDTDITGEINPIASTTVTGVSTIFTKEAKIGDKLVVSSETRTIVGITSDTVCTVDVATTNTGNDATPEIHPAAFVVTDDGGGIDLLVDTDGKVGVNCATPGAQVDVRGTTGTGAASAGVLRLSTAELTVADADQLGRIEFIAPLEASGTDAILVGASIYAEADDTFASDNNATELVFATGASEAAAEKMRIASDGKIGVNCSDPGAQVDIRGVAGTGTATAGVLRLSTAETTVVDADQLGRIEFIAPKETGADALLVAASIYAEADATFSATVNSTDLIFATGDSEAATEKLRIDSLGNATFADGALDVNIASHDTSNGLKLGGTLVSATAAELNLLDGSSVTNATVSKAVVLDSSGNIALPNTKGISFAATADGGVSTPSELLDDYEEGTWTPVEGTVGFGTAVGAYTKIGRLVQVTMYAQWNATGSPAAISGLPYDIGPNTCFGTVGFNQVNTNGASPFVYGVAAQDYFYIYGTLDDGSWGDLQFGGGRYSVVSTDEIVVTLVYSV